MATLTIHNLPDEMHHALLARADKHGRSIETEVLEILDSAMRAKQHLKLGSLLADIGRQARLSDAEFTVFEPMRDSAPARILNFD